MSLMDVIRCDLKSYLVWKWRPRDAEPNDSRQNSIRWGSSLRVKDGEMAIFVYSGLNGGDNHDVIVGPYDEVLKTANLPILANILGSAYNGTSPFQAEIYFINLANNIQVMFGVPWFNAFDSRYPDLPVPVCARGTMTFNITDYKEFIRLNRLINFNLLDFKEQIKAVVIKYTKNEIINKMRKSEIPLVQIESHVLEISEDVENNIRSRISDFGVNLKAYDIDAIDIDEEADSYETLKKLTIGIKEKATLYQARLQLENLEKTQEINAENMAKTLEIQRDETAHAQRMQTDANFFNVHSLNTQADVMKTASMAMGQAAGNVGGSGGGFNPAGVMTNMMLGGAVGGQMAGMMNQSFQNMNQTIQQSMQAPPPMPNVSYFVLINGQQSGPYQIPQIIHLIQNGMITPDSYVWKQGMAQWDVARNTELAQLFQQGQPPMPPQFPPIPNNI